jgi:ferrous iron transport protein B
VLFSAIFFPENASTVVFLLYLLGIITAVVLGIILKNTIFKGKEQSAFVMELPPYRVPTLRGIWFHMWERTSAFVRKAWTIIMATSILMWFLMAIPVHSGGSFANTDVDNSVFATIGKVIAPIFTPLGFGNWEASSALVTGFVAKEVVVSTMAQVYAVDDSEDVTIATTFLEDIGALIRSFFDAAMDTIKALPRIVGINLLEDGDEEDLTVLMQSVKNGFDVSSGGHGALAALAYMVFVLIYTPCMAAVAAEKQELGSKWAWVSILGQFALAWIMAFVVFQLGKILGFG